MGGALEAVEQGVSVDPELAVEGAWEARLRDPGRRQAQRQEVGVEGGRVVREQGVAGLVRGWRPRLRAVDDGVHQKGP